MESLSFQLSSMFNVTAYILDSNRDNVKYSSDYGLALIRDVFNETKDELAPFCNTKRKRSWGNPNPFARGGLNGFRLRLESIATSLNNA